MKIEAVRTRALVPPQDDLIAVLDESLPRLPERSVVVVSSKVVAIWQGRCVAAPRSGAARRERKCELAIAEAERFLLPNDRHPFSRLFTIRDGVFGSMSGIDESNADGYFVLLPEDVAGAAREIRTHLMKRSGVAELGVIISDSRTMPMRNGTVGVSLGHAGFRALHDYRGTDDIFGRELHFQRMHVADSLATAANLAMGEGSEQTPLVVCTEVRAVSFIDHDAPDDFLLKPSVRVEEDVFAQFFAPHPWQRGGAADTNS